MGIGVVIRNHIEDCLLACREHVDEVTALELAEALAPVAEPAPGDPGHLAGLARYALVTMASLREEKWSTHRTLPGQMG